MTGPRDSRGVTLSRPVLIGLAAAVALIAIGAGIGIGVGTSRHGDETKPLATGTSQQPSGTSVSKESTASEPAGSAPPAATAPPVPATPYLCWNGQRKATLDACGSPYEGAKTAKHLTGLNWVFKDRGPRLEAQSPTCADIDRYRRLIHRQCYFTYQGSEVCIDWSQFRTFDAGRDDYDKIGSPRSKPLPGGGTVLTWGPINQDWTGCQGLPYKTAKMVKGQLWGIATYAASPEAAIAASNFFGEFRPTPEWSGVLQN